MLNHDISFKDYKRSNDIHGTVLYPAVMVAPVQKQVLVDIINKNQFIKLIDPFHGSGTALYEAAQLTNNIHIYGCDINPLANLITKVKLQGVSENIYNDIFYLKNRLQNNIKLIPHNFPGINKWFREDIITDLTKIRYVINEITDTKNRLFFWYMLIDVIRKYSNTRSSTYKLHMKKTEAINRIENKVISDYLSSVENNYHYFLNGKNNFTLIKGDAINYLKGINNNEFDICITSPPYGDNATTVPYGQFSMLALYWIDPNDLELEGWELKNYSIIDSKSLGGPYHSSASTKNALCSDLSPYLNLITLHKQKKVLRFFAGYYNFLEQISRVTKSYIIMTLGNRTVDGVNINLTELTIKYLTKNGFKLKEKLRRDIVVKRIPRKVSCVKNHPVSSMNEEYLVVLQKLDT